LDDIQKDLQTLASSATEQHRFLDLTAHQAVLKQMWSSGWWEGDSRKGNNIRRNHSSAYFAVV